jgi:hypothetical protein
VGELFISVISGLLLSALGAVSVKTVQMVKQQRRLGHLTSLMQNVRRVQVVIPSFEVGDFLPRGAVERAAIPPNIKVLLMPEASAVADLLAALYEAGASQIDVVRQEDFRDDGLTISLGGPSVNSISADLLRRSFPDFRIKYPEHIASYGSTSFVASTDDKGELVEDYGFLASSRTATGHRCIVLCGVWAFGTRIAATTLIRMPRRSRMRKMLRSGIPFLAVIHGQVDGFATEHPNVVEIRRHDRTPTAALD